MFNRLINRSSGEVLGAVLGAGAIAAVAGAVLPKCSGKESQEHATRAPLSPKQQPMVDSLEKATMPSPDGKEIADAKTEIIAVATHFPQGMRILSPMGAVTIKPDSSEAERKAFSDALLTANVATALGLPRDATIAQVSEAAHWGHQMYPETFLTLARAWDSTAGWAYNIRDHQTDPVTDLSSNPKIDSAEDLMNKNLRSIVAQTMYAMIGKQFVCPPSANALWNDFQGFNLEQRIKLWNSHQDELTILGQSIGMSMADISAEFHRPQRNAPTFPMPNFNGQP